tara:strand:+ start:1026 stop:1316 length:291 start_codon:yes stop_codon:yes gene_type:complete
MLIETPYKVGDNVSFKLSSGEEIIARLEAEDAKSFTIRKPMVLIAGEKGLGLAPFMFSVSPDGKFVLQSQSVSCVAKTEKDIAKQYTSQTSGIQMI